MIDFTKVTLRHEQTEVPQGISLTDTDSASYIRVKVGVITVLVRAPKEGDGQLLKIEYTRDDEIPIKVMINRVETEL